MSENRIAASSGKRASGCSVTSVASDGVLREREKAPRLRARRVVLGQVAPGLAHQPDRRVRRGFAAQRAQEGVVFECGHRGERSARGTRPARPDSPRSANAAAGISGAARCCPSGTGRPRARTAVLRGSPRRRATGRGACRPRRRPSAPTSDSRPCPARTLLRASQLDAELLRAGRRARGRRKPIASSTRSAFISNSVPGISTIFGWPSASFCHSTRTATSFSTRPLRPSKRLVATAQSRCAAFLVRRRRAQLDRPVRPDQRLVLVLRRLRQQLELRDGLRAAGDSTCRRSRIRCRRRRSRRRACRSPGSGPAPCRRRRRGSAAAGTPSRSGCRRGRGPAPAGRAALRRRPSATTASYSASSASRGDILADVRRPAGTRRPRSTSAPCAGRSGAFSILKSGMP